MAPKRRPPPASARTLPSAVAVISEIVPEEARACWEIRNFSLVEKAKGRPHYSGPLVEAAGARFGIRAVWGGKEDGQDIPRCGLYCVREGETDTSLEPVKALVAITLVGSRTNITRQSRSAGEFKAAGHHKRGWSNIIELESLLDPAGGFLVDDTVVVELHINAWRTSQESARRLPSAPSAGRRCGGGSFDEASAKELCDDWAEIFIGEGTDVEVHGSLAPEDPPVRAHRLVLAARSPVFRCMLLSSSMLESQIHSKLNLEGADANIAHRFVRFLYINKLDPDTLHSEDALCHLLQLAHRYQVRTLLRQCIANITVTAETAVERLVMAEQLDIPELKAQVMTFLCGCRARLADIQRTDAFARMSRSLRDNVTLIIWDYLENRGLRILRLSFGTLRV
ncbi:unnamed protein product [Prorocentrum cordatum]|uniref:BTB domain-containing protein n=1 Tax=Prorocentrum cordatum TaxID=2364126 RepID=A0ABN9PQF7_9DINO|nr:unnamed protein product [Polarella glacialis]